MKKILVWLLAFLLTGCLVLFGLLFAGQQAVAPAIRQGGAPVNPAVVDREAELIRERITEQAAIYGFSPEPVIAFVDRGTLEEMNRDGSMWWYSILTSGSMGKVPALDKDALVKILRADPALMANRDEIEQEFAADEAAEAVLKNVTRVVLPFRQEAVSVGLQEAGKRLDIPNLVAALRDLPWTVLALAALLAGLIALLESRKLRFSLPYIGSAFGAAALVLIVILVLAGTMGIQPLIREASASLAIQSEGLFTATAVCLGVLAAVLLCGCALCLVMSSRKGRKA